MADGPPTFSRPGRTDPAGIPLSRDGAPGLRPEDFKDGFGEELSEAINVDNWRAGRDLDDEYRRIEAEVRQAVVREDDLQRRIRAEVLPQLAWAAGAPEQAGCYTVPLDDIIAIHRGLLFNGGVEACDGTSQVHDSLPLTIYQVGISLVSYRGDQGTWCRRLFRHDLRLNNGDPVEQTLELLDRRSRRGGLHQPAARDLLSELGERTIMSYAERAVLLRHAKAVWRMGHGSPAPLELLIGAGSPDLMMESVRVMRGLIEGHQKFVFVASEPGDRMLLTIGNGLHPLEYAIVCTLQERLGPALEPIHFSAAATGDTTWDGMKLSPEQWLVRFRDEVAPKVLVGMYRATQLGPAQVFYAHEDHFELAARVALADSVLQDERGFPLLIDLADRVCASVYGGGSLRELTATAYAAAGAPYRYQSERATRPR
jgi:hypothetical protein